MALLVTHDGRSSPANVAISMRATEIIARVITGLSQAVAARLRCGSVAVSQPLRGGDERTFGALAHRAGAAGNERGRDDPEEVHDNARGRRPVRV
jgi:hypothetical protein